MCSTASHLVILCGWKSDRRIGPLTEMGFCYKSIFNLRKNNEEALMKGERTKEAQKEEKTNKKEGHFRKCSYNSTNKPVVWNDWGTPQGQKLPSPVNSVDRWISQGAQSSTGVSPFWMPPPPWGSWSRSMSSSTTAASPPKPISMASSQPPLPSRTQPTSSTLPVHLGP